MGCGCKTKTKIEKTKKDSNLKINKNIKNGYSLLLVRLLAFILSLSLLPIILIAIIWFMFKLFLLNKEIDMEKTLQVLSYKIKPFNENYEQEEEEEEEDYEIIDVEDISPITKK